MSDIRIHKTGEPDIVEASDGRLTLSVPIQIKRRSGRKLVTLPNGETAPVRPWDVAPTSIQLALARGHRWLAMLESGEAKSLKEIATREGIDNSYVSRMVNLTTLAPDIVAAILDNQRALLTVCTPVSKVAGVADVTVALPHIVGGQGILGTLPLPLNEAEQSALQASAGVIKAALDQLRDKL